MQYRLVVPMLRSCSFPGCETRTLSPYCWEHERLLRSETEDELEQVAMRDHPLARELAAMYTAAALPEPPSA